MFRSLLVRGIHTSNRVAVKVGDSIPSVTLYEGAPDKKVDLSQVCAKGKYVIFGVPGAFTPNCSKSHLPGFIKRSDALKQAGVKEIFCISVNDPFVMSAWGESQKAGGKVRCLADTKGDLTKALDLQLDLTAVLGTVRCKRFAMVVDDGKVTKLNVEPDGTGLTCSIAEQINV